MRAVVISRGDITAVVTTGAACIAHMIATITARDNVGCTVSAGAKILAAAAAAAATAGAAL